MLMGHDGSQNRNQTAALDKNSTLDVGEMRQQKLLSTKGQEQVRRSQQSSTLEMQKRSSTGSIINSPNSLDSKTIDSRTLEMINMNKLIDSLRKHNDRNGKEIARTYEHM